MHGAIIEPNAWRIGFLLLLIGITTTALPPRVLAQDLPEGDDAEEVESGEARSFSAARLFDHYLVQGGWITWVALVPLSVAVLALSIQYCLTIRRTAVLPPATVDHIGELLDQRQYPEAVQFAAADRSMIGYVIHSGLVESRNGYEAMERAMEEAIEERAAKMTRKIEYLNLIGNVSPMLGLLGTVNGIIGMFISIAGTAGIPVMARISQDLGSALVATFWGLLVAIPSLAVFGILRNRIDILMEECAVTADRLMSAFKPESAVRTEPIVRTEPRP